MISIGSPRSAMACAAAMRCPPLNASRFASAAARSIVFSAEIEVGESGIARVYLRPSSPANGSAEWPPDDRLQRVIQYPGVPYESRWAPCDRIHGPGQGQFPEGSIRPRGYMAPDARHSFAQSIYPR